MLLVAALVATAAWSYGFAQIHPVQRPISTTKFQKSARMTCEIQTSGEQFDGIVIHWYQQKEGKAPERLLYVSEGKVSVESGFLASRYTVGKVPSQKQFILTINRVIPDDAATYYCAYWDSHHDRNSKIITAKTPPSTAELQVSQNEGFMVAQRITIKGISKSSSTVHV